MSQPPIPIALLFGSYRPNALGRQVVRFLEDHISDRGHTPLVADAAAHNLPFLEDTYAGFLKNGQTPPAGLAEIHTILQKAKAFILISGEYNHLPQPGLLNMLNFFYPEYADKPAGLATYSVGNLGGVRTEYPLRTMASSLGIHVISPMLLVPNAQKTLAQSKQANNTPFLQQINQFLDTLISKTR